MSHATAQYGITASCRLYINLQVNMALYLPWSPWTHLKTCGPLPLLNAFPLFPPHLPPRPDRFSSLNRLHPLSPRCRYFLPGSPLLVIVIPSPVREFFFFFFYLCKMFRNLALRKDKTEFFMRNCSQGKVQTQQCATIIT